MTISFPQGRRGERRHASKISRAGALSLALVMSACAAESDDTFAETEGDEQPAPEVLSKVVADPDLLCPPESTLSTTDFYKWTQAENLPLANKPNGALVRCQRMNSTDDSYTKYRVLYKTTTMVTASGLTSELPLVASGLVYVPKLTQAEIDLYKTSYNQPILSNTHGATGVIAECGPSRKGAFGSLAAMRDLSAVIGKAVLTAPDYVGLGVDHGYEVPDRGRKTVFGAYAFDRVSHPFVSIESEGRATIDLVRTTLELPATWTSNNSRWLVAGVSQGGHAALATGEVYGRGYGTPGPVLKGAIAGAPASELDSPDRWPGEAKPSVFAMMAVGASLENRDISASKLLTEPAITTFAGTTNKSCFDNAQALFQWWSGYVLTPYDGIFQPGKSPFSNPTTLAILAKNSPGRVKLKVPVFIGQIAGDPLIQFQRTDIMVDKTRNDPDSKKLVTYCRYDAVVGGSTSIERAYNHDAYRRMFPQKNSSGAPADPYTPPACYDSTFVGSVAPAPYTDQTPSTGIAEVTPVAWALKNFFAP